MRRRIHLIAVALSMFVIGLSAWKVWAIYHETVVLPMYSPLTVEGYIENVRVEGDTWVVKILSGPAFQTADVGDYIVTSDGDVCLGPSRVHAPSSLKCEKLSPEELRDVEQAVLMARPAFWSSQYGDKYPRRDRWGMYTSIPHVLELHSYRADGMHWVYHTRLSYQDTRDRVPEGNIIPRDLDQLYTTVWRIHGRWVRVD